MIILFAFCFFVLKITNVVSEVKRADRHNFIEVFMKGFEY